MYCHRTIMMVFFLLLSTFTPCVFGLAQESFGNFPVSPKQDWPMGIEALIKSPGRIYSRWVNGDERFYYAGEVKMLNDFLKLFGTIKTPVHLLIIDEEWNKVTPFNGSPLRYDWMLRVPSGLYRAHTIKEKGTDANEQYPSIYIAAYSDRINFDYLIIPENIKMAWPKDRDKNKAPSGKEAIIVAQQWSKAMTAWNKFANSYLEEIRKEEIDPSRQWVEIRSAALSTWLPTYRFYVFETSRITRSSTFALDEQGGIFDLGRGDWSGPADNPEELYQHHMFRNEKLTDFLKNNHLKITDANAAIGVAKLIEELSFTAQAVMNIKRNSKNFRIFDKRIYGLLFDKENNWRYTAERKNDYWQIEQKYIGPPASIVLQPQWQLIVDPNNHLSDVRF